MIIPNIKYPTRTAVDAAYPYGKAQNVNAAGSGDGTPLDKDWLNDLWGFCQALVLNAGITPSGTPDTANSSQLLEATKAARSYACYAITGNVYKNTSELFGLTLRHKSGNYVLSAGSSVIVPAAGKYRVGFYGNVESSQTTNPMHISIAVGINGSATTFVGRGSRWSASTSDNPAIAHESIHDIAAGGSICLVSQDTNQRFSIFGSSSSLIIERVG